jgi:hypothetical protein
MSNWTACAQAFAHEFEGREKCVSWSKLMPEWRKPTPLMPVVGQALLLAKLGERFKPEAVYGKA